MAEAPTLSQRLAAFRADLAERVEANPICGREHAAFVSAFTDALVAQAFAEAKRRLS